MTYKKLYENAMWKLERSEITGGEFDEMTKPLDEEIRPHGEWIETGRVNVFGGFEIKCSNCHNTLMVSPDRWEFGENFCDICGSRNKKEGEAE